jgi:hypothetical protein
MIRLFMVAPILGCMLVVGYAEEKTRQLSCTGLMIEPTALSQSPKSVRLNWGSSQKVELDFGDSNLTARVVSNNKIQLKFRAKDFVGELFHYTNDLFLIYQSGHLARLTCNPEG